MRAPGDLRELGPVGQAAWRSRVARIFEQAAASLSEPNRFVRERVERPEARVTTIDWTAFPVRVAQCLSRRRACTLLDRPGDTVDKGGRGLQEEYAEWRTSARDGVIERFELTTELPDYWRVLAAHEPERVLELVKRFSGEEPRIGDVFGSPDALEASPEIREAGFTRTMLGPEGRSPYNDGRRAISCMVQRSNDLRSLVGLALAATACRLVRDVAGNRLRCLTCAELAPLLPDAAQLGRASDPILVERLGRLAYEGREVAFDDPIGVYVGGVAHSRLRTPRGGPVPAEWFSFDRGTGPGDAADGFGRYQRVSLEVPHTESFAVGDLIDVATERPIANGGDLADLVRLVVRLRVSGRDSVLVNRNSPVELKDVQEDLEDCAGVRRQEREILGSGKPA